MEMVKKFFILTILFFSINININANDLSSFIQDSLDSSTTTSVASGYYKTQTRGYYSLGGKRIRWEGLGTIYPFTVTAQKLDIGCSGIDLVMGGFGYLDFDQLVEKFKKIAAAAPAFAFKMAISTFCKDCENIMNDLENIANTINGMNFDTCEMMNSASTWAGNQLGTIANFNNSSDTDWSTTVRNTTKDWDTQLKNYMKDFSNIDNAHDKLMQGSVVQKISSMYTPLFSVKGNEKSNTTTYYEMLLRALIGDMYGYAIDTTTTTSSPIKIEMLEPQIDIEKFSDIVLNGGTLKIKDLGINYDATNEVYRERNKNAGEVELKIDKGLETYTREKISDILNKINSNQTIENSDINFVENTSIPIYRMINLMSLGYNELDQVTVEVIAYEQLKSLMYYILTEMQTGLNEYKTKRGDEIDNDPDLSGKYSRLYNNLSTLRNQINNKFEIKTKEYQAKIEIVKQYLEKERDLTERIKNK